MATREHEVFTAPETPDALIWRYMDFTKYVSMLETSALYFSRADKLGDPFEGSITKKNVEKVISIEFTEGMFPNLRHRKTILQLMRKWVFVNCWHSADHESAAMWKLYGQSGNAVVVQSTFGRLRSLLPDSTFLGIVHYIDYDSSTIPANNLLWPFVHKRRSFEHEREVRAVYAPVDCKIPSREFDNPPDVSGHIVPIDLAALIDQVIVAPQCDDWYMNLVTDVTQRYGLDVRVNASQLDILPQF